MGYGTERKLRISSARRRCGARVTGAGTPQRTPTAARLTQNRFPVSFRRVRTSSGVSALLRAFHTSSGVSALLQAFPHLHTYTGVSALPQAFPRFFRSPATRLPPPPPPVSGRDRRKHRRSYWASAPPGICRASVWSARWRVAKQCRFRRHNATASAAGSATTFATGSATTSAAASAAATGGVILILRRSPFSPSTSAAPVCTGKLVVRAGARTRACHMRRAARGALLRRRRIYQPPSTAVHVFQQ